MRTTKFFEFCPPTQEKRQSNLIWMSNKFYLLYSFNISITSTSPTNKISFVAALDIIFI